MTFLKRMKLQGERGEKMANECEELGKRRDDIGNSTLIIFDHKYNPFYKFVFPLGENNLDSNNERIEYLRSRGYDADFTLPFSSGFLTFKMRRLEKILM